jgi:hypothetical protein
MIYEEHTMILHTRTTSSIYSRREMTLKAMMLEECVNAEYSTKIEDFKTLWPSLHSIKTHIVQTYAITT